jgi:hypothetical protein
MEDCLRKIWIMMVVLVWLAVPMTAMGIMGYGECVRDCGGGEASDECIKNCRDMYMDPDDAAEEYKDEFRDCFNKCYDLPLSEKESCLEKCRDSYRLGMDLPKKKKN